MKRHSSHSSDLPQAAGPRFWSGIEELADDPAFQAWVDVEYPAAADFAPTARREFLKLMGASFALAGLTGCEKSPFVAALPYVDQPETETPGLPHYYASAVTFDGYAQPVIATTYSGRPTKLDGNPDHPATRGRSDIFMQAAVLGLYDPDRAQGPARHGEPVGWNEVASALRELREGWRSRQGEGLRLLIGPTTSPTLLRQLDALLQEFPKARFMPTTAVGSAERRSTAAAAYGQPWTFTICRSNATSSSASTTICSGQVLTRFAMHNHGRRRGDGSPTGRASSCTGRKHPVDDRRAGNLKAGRRCVPHAASGAGAGRHPRGCRRRAARSAPCGARLDCRGGRRMPQVQRPNPGHVRSVRNCGHGAVGRRGSTTR